MSRTRVVSLLALSVLLSTLTANAQEPSMGKSLGELPLTFVENRGQWETPAQFVARRDGLTVRFENVAMILQRATRDADEKARGVAVRMVFEGALESASIEGEGREAGYHSFFLGNDPAKWRARVPAYDGILYRGLYPGVDVRVREKSRQLEYDVLLAPDADLEQVVIRCEGGEGLEIEPDGTLVIDTALGPIRQQPPATWYELESGERRPVECRYCLVDATRFGFEVTDRDPSLALVIDPGMEWSSFLGGQFEDIILDIEVDALSGEVVAAGGTFSSDFPTTPGSYDPSPNGSGDAFVARIAADGSSLIWSTVLGASAWEWALGLSVDDSGVVTVAGRAGGPDFPTTPGAYDETHNGLTDAFVAQLDATGSSLLYSTYIGGASHDWAVTVSVDEPSGEAVVTGYVESADYPTTPGAHDPTLGGVRDAFVTRLDASGSGLVFSTFLGGSANEGFSISDPYESTAMGAAISSSGAVTAAGRTASSDFPTTVGAYDTSYNTNLDGFVTRLDAAGSLVFSTYLGGTSSEGVVGLVVDEADNTTVGGWTYSQNFPTTVGAFDTIHNHPPGSNFNDGFVSQLDATGSTLLYSTFIGGARWDVIEDLAVYGPGEVVVTGWVGPGFPTTQWAYDESYNGGPFDAFLSHLRMAGDGVNDLVYSTFLGGGADDYGFSVAARGQEITVAGETLSEGHPTTPGSFQPSIGGGYDAFITRFRDLRAGIHEDPPAVTSLEPRARLGAPLPNPTSGRVFYDVDLSQQTRVRVGLFDVQGRLVRSLIDKELPAGSHHLTWDPADGEARLPVGAYYLRLSADGAQETRKIFLMR